MSTDDATMETIAGLRLGRPLLAYVTIDPPTCSTTVGPSSIPASLCDPVEPDGTIRVRRVVSDPFLQGGPLDLDSEPADGAPFSFARASRSPATGDLPAVSIADWRDSLAAGLARLP